MLIIGAGLSGIGAAYYLQKKHPHRTIAIFEGRENLGGTWDLYKYPGVRSDSQMYSYAYSFRPWMNSTALADGNEILNYLKQTTETFGIQKKIFYQHKVTSISWSSQLSKWTVQVHILHSNETKEFQCNFLCMCTGYYNYETAQLPEFPGQSEFTGKIVHPQFWTQDIELKNKKVVVVGSGATAMSLVPAIAKSADHVTLLQRSPSYIVTMPGENKFAKFYFRLLPSNFAAKFLRIIDALTDIAYFYYCYIRPAHMKKKILTPLRDFFGAQYVSKHLTPSYNPWNQRLCRIKDGDLLKAIKSKKVTIVTNQIQCFKKNGLKLLNGEELSADLIIMATGFNLLPFGGIKISVDNQDFNITEHYFYKGLMIDSLPNFVTSNGYVNSAYTLRAELTFRFLCRLLSYMDKNHFKTCIPKNKNPIPPQNLGPFRPGYFVRAFGTWPMIGSKNPWSWSQNYFYDLLVIGRASFKDKSLTWQ